MTQPRSRWGKRGKPLAHVQTRSDALGQRRISDNSPGGETGAHTRPQTAMNRELEKHPTEQTRADERAAAASMMRDAVLPGDHITLSTNWRDAHVSQLGYGLG